jgi:hypothetical protein
MKKENFVMVDKLKTALEQDADLFINRQFCGEIYLYKGTTLITVCTPQADYEFTLTKIIPKEQCNGN